MSKLYFIYNSTEILMNNFFHFFHEIMDPETFDPDGSKPRNNYIGMQRAWKDYLDWISMEKQFCSEPIFRNLFPAFVLTESPCIVLQESNGNMNEIIKKSELENIDLSQFTELLKERVVFCRIKNQNN